MHRATGSILDRMSQCFLEGGQYNVCRHLECGQEPGGELNMAGHVCFDVQLSLILGIMNSTDRREEKRNFLIQGRRFRRSFKNYCNYRYFMKLSRLLSIVKLGIDVLLSEHLQSRCIDSSMYRYTPRNLVSSFIKQLVGSRQRSLSSHFTLPRRERPLLAGKFAKTQHKRRVKNALKMHYNLFQPVGNATHCNYIRMHWQHLTTG